MRWPLRRQILLPMVGILLLTLGIVSVLNAWLATARVQRGLEQQLADVSNTLSTSNFPLESSVLRQLRGLTGADYVVVDASGRATAASDDAFTAAIEPASTSAWSLKWSTPVNINGRSFVHVVAPLERRAAGSGRHVLHVFYPEAAWREARRQAIWPPLAIGVVSVALVAVVVCIVARNVTRPIANLRSHVERIARGEFRQMPVPARNDEIQDLASAINQMAHWLTLYEEQIRHNERLRAIGTLGSGIAHQIRNAATGCRIALDLHRRDHPSAVANEHASEPPSRRQATGANRNVRSAAIDAGKTVRSVVGQVRPRVSNSGSDRTCAALDFPSGCRPDRRISGASADASCRSARHHSNDRESADERGGGGGANRRRSCSPRQLVPPRRAGSRLRLGGEPVRTRHRRHRLRSVGSHSTAAE